jgi:tetratricopeptide (TPR) repeat protein
MFDTLFAQLFRAVDRIRQQLQDADEELRRYLAEELECLERFGETLLDRWMMLDEQIQELRQTYGMTQETVSPVPSAVVADSAKDAGSLSIWFVPASSYESSWSQGWAQLVLTAPDPVVLTFRKGLGYLDLEMYDDAQQAFAAVVDATDDLLARVYLAAALAASGKSSHALSQLGMLRARTRDPLLLCAADEIEAWVHAQRGRFHEAACCLEDVVRRNPDYPDAWYNLGLCYLQLGNLPAAEHASMRALTLGPEDADTRVLLAYIHLERGDVRAACETCHEGLRLHQGNPGLLTALVHALAASGDVDSAASLCRRLYWQYPERTDLFRLLLQLSLAAQRLEEARALLKKQVALRQAGAAEWLALAVLELLGDDIDKADEAVSQALQLHADAAVAALILGEICARRKEAKNAVSYFLQALRDPRRTVKRLSLYLLGRLALDQGKPAEAERYLKAAWVLGRPNPAIAAALGEALGRLGRQSESGRWLIKAANP